MSVPDDRGSRPTVTGGVSLLCRDAAGLPFRAVPVVGERFRIGRRAENDLIVSNASVSRLHAEIVHEHGRWFVLDNDSKFGTFVNGERVVRAHLTPGDEIRLGGDDGPVILFRAGQNAADELDKALYSSDPPSTAEGHEPIVAGQAAAEPVDVAKRLVERFRATSLIGDYREALTLVVDAALQLTQFSHAALCLVDKTGPTATIVRVEAARTRSGVGTTLSSDRVATFVRSALEVKATLVVSSNDESVHSAAGLRDMAQAGGVSQVVCVPIVTFSEGATTETGERVATQGALYLEDTAGAPPVTSRLREVLESLALEAGSVLERMRSYQADFAHARERLESIARVNEARACDASLTITERAQAACALAEFQQCIGALDESLLSLEGFLEASMRSQLPVGDRGRILKALGTSLMWQSKWHRAVGVLNAAIDALGEGLDEWLVHETRVLLARCYCEIGELGIARDLAFDALTELRNAKEPSASYASALHVAGVIAENDGDLASAAHVFREALRIAEMTKSFVTLVGAHYRIGRVHFARGDTSEATESFQRMLEAAHPFGNPHQLAFGQAALAASLVRSGAWRRADSVIAAGLVMATRGNRVGAMVQLLRMSATIATYRDGGTTAAAALTALRSFAEKTDDAEIAVEADYLEAELLVASGRRDEARTVLEGAIRRSTHLGDSALVARLHLTLAEADRQGGDLVAAAASVQRAHDAVGDSRDMLVVGLSQRTTGRIHADAGRHTEAQHSLAQSLSIFRTIDDQRLIGLAHLDIGNLMLAASDPACARTHLRQARDIFAELEIRGLQSAAESGLRTAMASGGVASAASYSSIVLGAHSEPRFVRRLLEAAQSRELLLCELTAIALDIVRATSALAVACSPDGDFTVLASSGEKPSGGLPVTEIIAASRGQVVRSTSASVYPLEPSVGTGSGRLATVVYVNAAISPGSRADAAMQLVVQLARQGLELVALRAPERRAIRTDRSAPERLPAAVSDPDGDVLLYESAGMRILADRLQRIRTSSSTVLITGESGVGKELVARAIHLALPRHKAPFVPFNCSAVSRELIESQIFGHRKGAFTGASSDNPGLARSATNGTLFLDEIGDLPLDLQPKFLRFLESGEILPLGATEPLRVQVRVVAATNANLEELVEARLFREDLYHRLNIIRLHVPPLRERREDIPLLAGHFLSRLARRAGRATVPKLSPEALNALVGYGWPGNVRQLRNEVERIFTFGAEGTEIAVGHLSDEIRLPATASRPGVWSTIVEPHGDVLAERLRQYEIDQIRRALAEADMNVTHAAGTLGMARQNLQRRMRKLGLSIGDS